MKGEELQAFKEQVSPVRGNIKFFKAITATQDVQDLDAYKFFQQPDLRAYYQTSLIDLQKQADDIIKKHGSLENIHKRREELDKFIIERKRDTYISYRDHDPRHYTDPVVIQRAFDHLPPAVRLPVSKSLDPHQKESEALTETLAQHQKLNEEMAKIKASQQRMDDVLTRITDPQGLRERLMHQFDEGVKDIASSYRRYGQLRTSQPAAMVSARFYSYYP